MEAGKHAAGRWAEAIAIAYFTRRGYDVHQSFGSHCPEDLVVIKHGVSLTVEVRIVFPDVTHGKDWHWKTKVKKTRADILLAVHPDEDSVWEIPGALVSHVKCNLALGPMFGRASALRRDATIDPDRYRVDGAVYGIHEKRDYQGEI